MIWASATGQQSFLFGFKSVCVAVSGALTVADHPGQLQQPGTFNYCLPDLASISRASSGDSVACLLMWMWVPVWII